MVENSQNLSANLDYDLLVLLQKSHPALRLLRSDHAPLIIFFLNQTFLRPNVRTIQEIDLISALEDLLFVLQEDQAEKSFPKPAREYLNDWSAPEKGWLRKFYPRDSDEPSYDLMPVVERVIGWLNELEGRSFVGTESRLLLLFDLLRQMVTGAKSDPEMRLAELQKRRAEIDAEIERVQSGQIETLDDTALRDRFQQFTYIARDLLSDFREVEQNFRQLDRSVRERIALWDGSKAELLDEIMGRRDAIDDSDQGRSFRAFWDFLMSDRRQQELSELLDTILENPAISSTHPDPRLRRVHYDWLEAGDHTQRTVAELSKQLRRFLDDQAWLENRRIIELLQGIESKALKIRENLPKESNFMAINGTAAALSLPFERPLFTPPFKPNLATQILSAHEEEIDTAALFAVRLVDKTEISHHIRRSLQGKNQISLRELINARPPEYGLAEIIAYLELGHASFRISIDESIEDILQWTTESDDGKKIHRSARLPRIIFLPN